MHQLYRTLCSASAAASLLLATACTGSQESPDDQLTGQPSSPSIAEEERLDYKYFQDRKPQLPFGMDSATLGEGWDYASCSEIERNAGTLTDPDCQYAVELHYISEDESTKFALMLLAAPPDINTEERTVFGDEVADVSNLAFHDEARLPDFKDEATAVSPTAGEFALVTVATTTSGSVDLSEAVEHLNSNMVTTLQTIADKES